MRKFLLNSLLCLGMSLLAFCPSVIAGDVEWVTTQSGLERDFDPFISKDGNVVGFLSYSVLLDPIDTDTFGDVYVYDKTTGNFELISVATDGTKSDAGGQPVTISDDNRYVIFVAKASNLMPNDNNSWEDLYIRDRVLGTTECLSLNESGVSVYGRSNTYGQAISADNRYVVFQSAAYLTSTDINAYWDIYLHDRTTNTKQLISLGLGGQPANQTSNSPAIAANGSRIVFRSQSMNLVANDQNGTVADIFSYDMATGQIELVSQTAAGVQSASSATHPSVSDDGNYVLFSTMATEYRGDTPTQLYRSWRKNMTTGALELASVNYNNQPLSDHAYTPKISPDGRFVIYDSSANDIVTDDLNTDSKDLFIRDMDLQTNAIVNEPETVGGQYYVVGDDIRSLTTNARYVPFAAFAINDLPTARNEQITSVNIFIKDMADDTDGDNYYVYADIIQDDCDNDDPAVNPGMPETTYNGKDDDCDALTLDDDIDQDGYIQADECNDDIASIYPGAPETINDGVDQDCNGYDLSIQVSSAIYDSKKETLDVIATSSYNDTAALTIEFNGLAAVAMVWDSRALNWEYSGKKITLAPTEVIISGPEGTITQAVTVQ